MSEQNQIQADESPAIPTVQEINVDKISSAVLARLIAEVRDETPVTLHAYNRTHNRHNRGR